jgi:hypothetical protein
LRIVHVAENRPKNEIEAAAGWLGISPLQPGKGTEGYSPIRCQNTTLPPRIAGTNGGAARHFKPPAAPFLQLVHLGGASETNGNTDYRRPGKTALSAILVCPKLLSCVSCPALAAPKRRRLAHPNRLRPYRLSPREGAP